MGILNKMGIFNNKWVHTVQRVVQDEEVRAHARETVAVLGAAAPSLLAIKDRVVSVLRETRMNPGIDGNHAIRDDRDQPSRTRDA